MIEGKVIAVSAHGIKISENWYNGPCPDIYKGDWVRLETDETNAKKIKSILKIDKPERETPVEKGEEFLDKVIDRQIGLWKKISGALEQENWLGFQTEEARQ